MGKSTVSDLFKKFKIPVVCADEISKEIAAMPSTIA